LNIDDFRKIFFVCSIFLLFFAILPIFQLVFPFYVEEAFSEISILGSNQMAEDYPFNIISNQEERVFIQVNNHMNKSVYYQVLIKFRNQTQSFPQDSNPSLLDPLYEYRFFLLDGETWEEEVNFDFLEIEFVNDYVQVNRLLLNNIVLDLNSSSVWDSTNNGFYFQLFFELWSFDPDLYDFAFYDRGFVGLWLNMTS
jgi:uncharacterized membrane protein